MRWFVSACQDGYAISYRLAAGGAIASMCVLADPAFRKNVDGLIETERQAAEAPAWFQRNHPQAPLTCAAYFSMEFMLSEALPIYSGGLGAALLTRLIASLLYGVAPSDAATLVGVSILLAVVALGASYVPAQRAARADPMDSLRYE